MKHAYIILFLLTAGLLMTNDSEAYTGETLDDVFTEYCDAIQASDLELLFATVTQGDEFTFITAGGRRIDGREGYYNFHVDWFSEKDWTIEFELEKTVQQADWGYTVAIFRYAAKTPEGEPYSFDSHFTLFFTKENGRWVVVADICTPIRGSEG
ncbi:MAG: nuclear transport factor 2 family protein [bacterium]